jgi:hypothetical protein
MKPRPAAVGYTDAQIIAGCGVTTMAVVSRRFPRTILQWLNNIEGAGHKLRAVSWPDGTVSIVHWPGNAAEPPADAVINAYREALALADA